MTHDACVRRLTARSPNAKAQQALLLCMPDACMQAAAACVRVKGPDPRLVKASGRAFHQAENGLTTISASGLVASADELSLCIVTPVSVILPFVKQEFRLRLPDLTQAHVLPSACIEVFWEGYWCQAQLITSFQVPRIQAALSCWLERDGSQWESAWALNGGVQTVTPEVQAYLAVLSCQPSNKTDAQGFAAAAAAACSVQWSAAPTSIQGSHITAVGSPFGAISPHHFANSIVHGVISNCWSPDHASDSGASPDLLMADLRCLPGMEGGAVLDRQGKTVAMVMVPLLSKAFNAEVPLLMPIEHIAAGWGKSCQADNRQLSLPHLAMSGRNPVGVSTKSTVQKQMKSEQALAVAANLCSVVLLSASDGSGWASGIVLSKKGFILTNAHAVQPRSSSCPQHSSYHHSGDSQLPLVQVRVSSSSSSSSKVCWYAAEVVYVFRHALDLAVLRLQAADASLSLHPAMLYNGELQSGQAVNAVGHALFSPKWQMQPSVTAGNITKVVYSRAGNGRSAALVMTSATVHAGASGGAVMADDGRIIGITTSNAKHSASGSTIPNLNFAVAADALRPLWALAREPGLLTREALQRIDVEDPALAALFSLSTPPEQEASLSQNAPDQVQKKGSERLADLLLRKGLHEHSQLIQGSAKLVHGKSQVSKL